MSAPWGHTHRDDPGPRGWLARRWGEHRRRRVARALARHGTPGTSPRPPGATPSASPSPSAPEAPLAVPPGLRVPADGDVVWIVPAETRRR